MFIHIFNEKKVINSQMVKELQKEMNFGDVQQYTALNIIFQDLSELRKLGDFSTNVQHKEITLFSSSRDRRLCVSCVHE